MAKKKNNQSVAPHIRRLHAYREGMDAFMFGEVMAECPYPQNSGDNRIAWHTGWLDARTASKFGWEVRNDELCDRHVATVENT